MCGLRRQPQHSMVGGLGIPKSSSSPLSLQRGQEGDLDQLVRPTGLPRPPRSTQQWTVGQPSATGGSQDSFTLLKIIKDPEELLF